MIFIIFYLIPAIVIGLLHLNLFYQHGSFAIKVNRITVNPLLAVIVSFTPVINFAMMIAVLTIAGKDVYNRTH
jgi:hypothetical protein